LKYKTLVNKRTVYGGGGIMPDIFVPLDTTEYSDYHRNLVGKGVINSTVMDYLNSNRDELKKKYTTFDAFRKGFEVNDDFLKNLQENATKEKIPLNEKQYNNSLRIIKLQLKSLIARDLWGDNEASQILDIANKPLQKAIELFQSKTGYEDVLKSVGTNSSDNKSNK
jgi:carboxyl-terminal processing protease